jgi:hypothetical protein
VAAAAKQSSSRHPPKPLETLVSNSTQEPGHKAESPVRKIAVGVIIAVVAGGSSPWWWAAVFPRPAAKTISAECSPEVLRNQLFRAGSHRPGVIEAAAITMRIKFSLREFECVSNLATVLLDQDQDNGHGLYFEGETWRAKAAADSTQSSFSRERMREYFLRYIANERGLPLDERGGDSKACYEREKGYCAERTAWISHLLAADYFQWAESSKDKGSKKQLLERAARFLKADLDFGGFEQVIPSAVLKERITEEFEKLGVHYPTNP